VKQDALGRAALVRGDDVPEARERLHDVAEAVEGAAPGVGLVALHQRAPLGGGHRAGARVGEQVDEHVVGMERKTFHPAAARADSRSARVVKRTGSTDLIRNGSMMVLKTGT
jgi:hypothetical protein